MQVQLQLQIQKMPPVKWRVQQQVQAMTMGEILDEVQV